jgi:hypothetical protein
VLVPVQEPGLRVLVQPELPVLVQRELPVLVRRELPVLVRRELPVLVRRELPGLGQPALARARPGLPVLVRLELLVLVRLGLLVLVQPALVRVRPGLLVPVRVPVLALARLELLALVRPGLPVQELELRVLPVQGSQPSARGLSEHSPSARRPWSRKREPSAHSKSPWGGRTIVAASERMLFSAHRSWWVGGGNSGVLLSACSNASLAHSTTWGPRWSGAWNPSAERRCRQTLASWGTASQTIRRGWFPRSADNNFS